MTATFRDRTKNEINRESQCVSFSEFPEQSPTIDDVKQYYNVGDYLETNCTSNSSIPPATLEWWTNDVPAHIEHIVRYDTVVDPISKRQTSILGLRLPLTNEHFFQGRLKVSGYCC